MSVICPTRAGNTDAIYKLCSNNMLGVQNTKLTDIAVGHLYWKMKAIL